MAISYVEPVDHRGKALPYGHPQRTTYESGLLHDLALHPSLSFASIIFDLVYCPANLFFNQQLRSIIGEFHHYSNLFYLDYFLRSCLVAEPTLIRERLLKHEKRADAFVDEHAEIIEQHILGILAGRATNPLADVFTKHGFRFGQRPAGP